MKEDFLHYIWRYTLYPQSILKTTTHESIQVVKPGKHNTNEGPDFLNSELVIDGQKWVGNVEIHINTSDWYLHQHEIDSNYDAVILHVVWNHDTDVFMKDNRPLPTLELKGFIAKNVLLNYQKLSDSKLNWIPCEEEIKKVDSFVVNHWLERLFFERLEHKTIAIKNLLKNSYNDWEAVFFQMLSKNFGLSINSDAFLKLAQSFSFTILRKEKHEIYSLSALLFGQAGFLDEIIEDKYHKILKKEYTYLKKKYQLKGLSKNEFQFFRMRPYNFPTIRIAQLIALYHSKEHLFAASIKANNIEDYRNLFEINVEAYWKNHFNFGKSSNRSTKKLTKSFIDLILINTILPLKFYYLKTIGKLSEEEMIALVEGIDSEKNSIINKFSKLHIKARNAMQSQGLIELKNNYCTPKRCLECAIGKSILDR